MAMTDNYKPIPVDAARQVAESFRKDWVIILAASYEAGLFHTVSHAVRAEDKAPLAELAEWVTKAIGGDVAKRTTFEDFRSTPEAEAAAKIDALLAFARALDAEWTRDFPTGPDPSPSGVICRIAEPHRTLWRQCRAAIAKATTPTGGPR